MGGKLDRIKGCIQEAAGVLADDDNLKREGESRSGGGEGKGKSGEGDG